MTQRATDELIEFAKKSGLARKLELSNLQDAVLQDQHTVEIVLEDVAALEWPDNLLARMHYALERDDPDRIQEAMKEWHEWVEKVPPDVSRLLFRTLVRIEAYVEQYHKQDG